MLTPHENERERLRDDAPDLRRYVEEGTVGWADDKDSVSHGNDFADGNTLLKVTLFEGHPDGEPTTADGVANGHQILARVSGPVWHTPARGSRVVVLFPGGQMLKPGHGVVIAAPGPSPATRFGRDKVVLGDRTKDVTVIGRSVSLEAASQDQDGTKHYSAVSVAPEGTQVLYDGSGLQMVGNQISIKSIGADGLIKTSISCSDTELTLMDSTTLPTTAAVTLKGGNLTAIGQFVTIAHGTAMKLGLFATPATPMLGGPTGVAAVPSASIFIQVAP
jgi:hypothetical protein